MSGKNIFYLSAEDFFLQPIYSCIHCRANLAHHADLISKSFQGSQGRAYLFNHVVNVGSLVAEERMLLTGLHYVADIYCECCSFILGWKYERAFEPNQRYKEGKYIIELANLIKDNGWDLDHPRIRTSFSKENRRSFSIDWEASCDNISKSSLSRLCKSQTKNSFVQELSRDFQYLFGFYEKNDMKRDHGLPTKIDVSAFNENISSSVMYESQDSRGMMDLVRLNSDSDNLDSLQSSFTQSIVDHASAFKLKTTGLDLVNVSSHESAENSSLNTSNNSSKGLLGASCSSDLKTHKCSKSKPKKPPSDDSSASQYLPSFDPSLSAVSGSNSVMNTSHGNQHRHCPRHKHRSRPPPSNVVNPQSKGSVHHRRHHRSEGVQLGEASLSGHHRSQEPGPQQQHHHHVSSTHKH